MPATKTCTKVSLIPRGRPIKTIYFILALIAFVACAVTFQKYSLEIITWIDDLGWLAPVLFVITYGLAAILFLPTLVLTLAGGALFGPFIGTLLNLAGALCGATVSFLITRHLMYDWFSKKRGDRLNKLIAGVDKKGWMFVAFLRLIPIVPFNLVNYGLGITGIPFRLYILTTAIFLVPAEIIYTYFGYAGRHALTQPEQFYKSGGIALLALAGLFLAVITLIKKRKHNKPGASDLSYSNQG